jgi:hypothetical protein
MVFKDTQSPDTSATEVERRVGERFGVLPNFFRLAPETPEIAEKLWGFAQVAYLDNPLPSVFKERLFVYLSRFLLRPLLRRPSRGFPCRTWPPRR